jgi:hypothetical protein
LALTMVTSWPWFLASTHNGTRQLPTRHATKRTCDRMDSPGFRSIANVKPCLLVHELSLCGFAAAEQRATTRCGANPLAERANGCGWR